MYKKLKLIVVTMLILSLSMSSYAKDNGDDIKTLVYLDVISGEKVEFDDNSISIEESLHKWLEIAGKTFGYHDGSLEFVSIKATKKNIILDFSSNFYSIAPNNIEFEAMMWSLKETVFINTDVSKIIYNVNGLELEKIGEFDYTGGVIRMEEADNLPETNNDNVINSIPDVPDPVIVIDPGHGGNWNNATAIDGTLEKDIVLAVGNYLKTDLENKGSTVIMTRQTDTHFHPSSLSADLAARVDIANNNNADLFISLHCNGGGASSDGTEAFWPQYHDVSSSKSLANEITAKISSRHDLDQRWNRVGNFQVLNDTDMTAVLVELAFITNASDYSELDSVADRDAMAYSIYLGIRKFWWGY